MRAAKAITFFTKGYQETVQEVVKVPNRHKCTAKLKPKLSALLMTGQLILSSIAERDLY